MGEKGYVNLDTMQTWLKDVFPTLIEGFESSDIYNADGIRAVYNVWLIRWANPRG